MRGPALAESAKLAPSGGRGSRRAKKRSCGAQSDRETSNSVKPQGSLSPLKHHSNGLWVAVLWRPEEFRRNITPKKVSKSDGEEAAERGASELKGPKT